MAAALKKNLLEMIECGICLDIMVNARMLSCQHSFCADCLGALASRSSVPTVTCPTCRKCTPVPNRDVNHLPPDLKANALSELVSEPEGSEDSQAKAAADQHVDTDPGTDFLAHGELPDCAACPKEKTPESGDRVKWFCKFCKDYMCNTCADAHTNTKVFSDHNLVRIPESRLDIKKCLEHPRKSQNYYCEECQVLVCSACVTNQHKTHQVRHFGEYFKECEKEIKRKRGHLETIYSDSFLCNANEAKLENYQVLVNQKISKITKGIEKSADLAIKEIEKEKARLLSALDKDQTCFNQGFKDVQARAIKSDVQDVLKECEAYLNTRQPVEFLSDFEYLSLKIQTTTNTIKENEKRVVAFFESPVPSEFLEEHQKATIGSVKLKKIKTPKVLLN